MAAAVAVTILAAAILAASFALTIAFITTFLVAFIVALTAERMEETNGISKKAIWFSFAAEYLLILALMLVVILH